MKQDGLEYFTDTHLTVLALIIFVGYFIFIGWKALAMKLQTVERLENLPFENEDQNG